MNGVKLNTSLSRNSHVSSTHVAFMFSVPEPLPAFPHVYPLQLSGSIFCEIQRAATFRWQGGTPWFCTAPEGQ